MLTFILGGAPITNFLNYNYEVHILDPKYDGMEEVKDFLAKFDLYFEKDIEKTIVVRNSKEILGTGSYSQNVIKDVAVDLNYQGQGILNTIISKLKKIINNEGYSKIFVYTQPANVEKFKYLGFKEITRLNKYPVFMENSIKGIQYSINQKKEKVKKTIYNKFGSDSLENYDIASITVNCNPITNGHLYLIKKAAKENEIVIIFVLDEDLSLFPAEVRYNLVKKATSDIDNVIVVKAGEYMISHATFPNYFIGPDNEDERNRIFAELDAKIFAEYYAKFLKINSRYVGEEPYSPVTAAYNKALKKYLPKYNIDIKIIKRKKIKGKAISASTVRQYIRDDKMNKVKPLVPQTTYDYLESENSKQVIAKIKKNKTRH